MLSPLERGTSTEEWEKLRGVRTHGTIQSTIGDLSRAILDNNQSLALRKLREVMKVSFTAPLTGRRYQSHHVTL